MGTKFKLGDSVSLSASSEAGEVVGVAVYADGDRKYLVYYMAGDGRAVETWWDEDRLVLEHSADE